MLSIGSDEDRASVAQIASPRGLRGDILARFSYPFVNSGSLVRLPFFYRLATRYTCPNAELAICSVWLIRQWASLPVSPESHRAGPHIWLPVSTPLP